MSLEIIKHIHDIPIFHVSSPTICEIKFVSFSYKRIHDAQFYIYIFIRWFAMELSAPQNPGMGIVPINGEHYETLALFRATQTMANMVEQKRKYTETQKESALEHIRRQKEIAKSLELQRLAFLGAPTSSDTGPLDDITVEEYARTEMIFMQDIMQKRESNCFVYKMIFGKDHKWRYYNLIRMAEMWIMTQRNSSRWKARHQLSDAIDKKRVDSVYDYLMILVLPENWTKDPLFLNKWNHRIVSALETSAQMNYCEMREFQNIEHTPQKTIEMVIGEHMTTEPSVPSDIKKQIEDLILMAFFCFNREMFETHFSNREPQFSFANPTNFRMFLFGNTSIPKPNHPIEVDLPASMKNSAHRIVEAVGKMSKAEEQQKLIPKQQTHGSMIEMFNKLILGIAPTEEDRSSSTAIMKNFVDCVVYARSYMMHGNYWNPNEIQHNKRMRSIQTGDVSFVHSV